MSFRRSAAAAAAAVALLSGCKKVSQEPPPNEVIVAAFSSPLVPSPNDVALASVPLIPAGAQHALLQAFVNAGGFPSDQAVSLTVPFVRYAWDGATNQYVPHPAVLDPATVTSTTFTLLRLDGGTTPVAWEIDPDNSTTAADGASWTLTIRRPLTAGNRRWPTGRYVFAVRGGPSGVKTTDQRPVGPDAAISLALQNVPLDNPENVPVGTPPDKMALLELVRKTLWLPLDWSASGGFWSATPAPGAIDPAQAAVSGVFPADELISFATFEIAPQVVSATVPVDSGSGIAPLPIDLLRTGPVTPFSAGQKTIAFNAAFGPAAAGLTTLNGFSTTAMILAPIVGTPIDAGTVNGATVHLFKLGSGAPTLLKELKQELGIFAATSGAQGDPLGSAYVAEPTPITTTTGCPVSACSTVVGLQPGVGAPVPAPLVPALGSAIYLPPLEDETDYAVVITTAVKDAVGRPLVKSTAAKILVDPGFDPIATSTSDSGIALLPGVPAATANATAVALWKMRLQLAPVMSALPNGETAANVVLAWTFRTQSVKATSLGIVALPYQDPVGVLPTSEDPQSVTTFTPATIAAQYGIDPTVLTTLGSIAELAEVKLRTTSWLLASQNSGAFDPAHATTEVVTALVAIPSVATGTCPGGFGYTAANCAPLVVFEHGLTSSKAAMLPIAGALAARGFVVAAIDQPLQGERSYCSGSGVNAQANADAMCCPVVFCGTQHTCAFKANLRSPVDVDGTAAPIQIGVCESAPGVRGRMLDHRLDNASTPSPKGTAFASANRLISLNFFRLRDTLRQDVIDESALVKALAPIGPGTDPFAVYLRNAYSVGVDFTKVYFVGHSGGAISGTQTLAVNPRITRAVTYAGGATFVDIAANPASSFHAGLVALLPPSAAEGTPAYLQLLQVGKWVLDPAEPANYAKYVVPGGVLPSPFAGTPLQPLFPAQPAREVLTQISLCDGTVPNPQNQLLSALLGFTVPPPALSTTGRVQWFSQSGGATCPADQVTHSNLIDFVTPSLTQQAQFYAGGFLASPVNEPTPVVP